MYGLIESVSLSILTFLEVIYMLHCEDGSERKISDFSNSDRMDVLIAGEKYKTWKAPQVKLVLSKLKEFGQALEKRIFS